MRRELRVLKRQETFADLKADLDARDLLLQEQLDGMQILLNEAVRQRDEAVRRLHLLLNSGSVSAPEKAYRSVFVLFQRGSERECVAGVFTTWRRARYALHRLVQGTGLAAEASVGEWLLDPDAEES